MAKPSLLGIITFILGTSLLRVILKRSGKRKFTFCDRQEWKGGCRKICANARRPSLCQAACLVTRQLVYGHLTIGLRSENFKSSSDFIRCVRLHFWSMASMSRGPKRGPTGPGSRHHVAQCQQHHSPPVQHSKWSAP